MCGEAVELAASHTQDELSSVPPFPLSKIYYTQQHTLISVVIMISIQV
jgi:hypothetical protein